MNVFNNYYDLLYYLHHCCQEYEIKGTKMKEAIDVKLKLNKPEKCLFYIDEVRSFDYVQNYLHGELAWYYCGEKNICYILKYSKFWNKVCDENQEVNSNYGNHIFYKKLHNDITNYDNCYDLLTKDRMSRQAVMLYNEPQLMFNNPKDYVCTQMQQFICRKDRLDSIIYIRSSDAVFGLTYDIPWWSLVQQSLAKDINADVGSLSINIGSSHLYERFYDLVPKLNIANAKIGSVKLKEHVPLNNSFYWLEENMHKFIEIKK